MSEAKLTSGYPDTPEYRFAQWYASQSKEYRDWFAEEHKKSMEAEKEREKGTERCKSE